MLFRFSDIIPKEHGAWAILLFPFLSGAFAKGTPGASTFLLLICVISIYLLRGCGEFYMSCLPQKKRYKNFNNFYISISLITITAIIAAILLLFYYNFWKLFYLGFAALILLGLYYSPVFSETKNRVNREIIALLMLTLAAPASYYVTSGEWNKNALLLWILNGVFYLMGLLYVHCKIMLFKKRNQATSVMSKIALSKNLLAGYYFSITTFLFLLAAGFISLSYFIILAPITIHIIIGIFLDKKNINLKRIGYIQVGQDILFLIILIVLFRTLN